MYDYYGYRRLAGSRAAETKSLGDVELVARGFNLLHPFAESGLGSYSTAGRGGRPIGAPRWAVGEVPIWGGLSDKEKILAVAAVLIGGYLFLNRKKASVFKKARMRANRPTCGACKDKLWSTDKLYKRNGRNVCAACKEFGSDAYTLPRKNPGKKNPERKYGSCSVWIEGGFGDDYRTRRLAQVAKIPPDGHGTMLSTGEEDASWHNLSWARAQSLKKRLKAAYPRAKVKVTKDR